MGGSSGAPTVCRSAYIHPAVLEGYLSGKTIDVVMRKEEREVESSEVVAYYPEEAALMRMLEKLDRSRRR